MVSISPESVQEAKAFDEDNGNTLSWDAICKEMKKIRPDFEVWEKKISEFLPGYQNITWAKELEKNCDLLQMGTILRPQR